MGLGVDPHSPLPSEDVSSEYLHDIRLVKNCLRTDP